jgi:hypothetical protein
MVFRLFNNHSDLIVSRRVILNFNNLGQNSGLKLINRRFFRIFRSFHILLCAYQICVLALSLVIFYNNKTRLNFTSIRLIC